MISQTRKEFLLMSSMNYIHRKLKFSNMNQKIKYDDMRVFIYWM